MSTQTSTETRTATDGLGRLPLICVLLIQILVGGAEEEFVGLGAGQQRDMFTGELEPADVAAFVAHPLHQGDRVGPELLQMAVFFLAAGNPRYLFELTGHDSSGYFSC